MHITPFGRLLISSTIALFGMPDLVRPQDRGTTPTATPVRIGGTIVDSEGQPLSNAKVCVENFAAQGRILGTLKVVSTDHRGRYDLSLGANGTDDSLHFLSAFKAGFAIARVPIDLSIEDVLPTYDLTLPRPESFVFRLADAQGQPIAGSTLATLRSKARKDVFSIVPEVLQALELEVPQTDANGVIELPWMPPNRIFEVGFDHRDFARGMCWSAKASATVHEVIMERGQETEFAFVCSTQPQAVADAWVRVTMSRDEGDVYLEIPVDAKGRAKARLFSTGTIMMQPRHPTLATQGVERYSGRRINTFALYEKATLRGRVVNSTDRSGVANLAVQVSMQRTPVTSTFTAQDGGFSIEVPATSLVVSIPEHSRHWKVEGGGLTIHPLAGQNHVMEDFLVEARLPLRGQVVFDGKPVPKAILVEAFAQQEITLADEMGRFEMPSPLGNEAVLAMHPYEPLSVVVTANAEQQDMVITLSPEGSFVGRVVDFQQQPLAAQRIDLASLYEADNVSIFSHQWRTTQSRQDGTFRFQGLSRGLKYRALVQRSPDREDRKLSPSNTSWVEASQATIQRVPLVVSKTQQERLNSAEIVESRIPARIPPSIIDGSLNALDKTQLPQIDLRGKTVLLCSGFLGRGLFRALELSRQLYSGDDFAVIAVIPEMGRQQKDELIQMLRSEKLAFPVAVDNQAVVEDRLGYCALYGADGLLVENLLGNNGASAVLPSLRNYFVFER